MAYVRIVVLDTTRWFDARLGRVPIPGDVIEAGGESFLVQPGVRLYANSRPADAEAEVTVLPV